MIYLELLWIFFKIGLFTFGGGYAMMAMMQDEMIRLGWSTMEEMMNLIAISESTPGTYAINAATFIGNRIAGFWGGIVATIGVVLPSIIIISIVANIFAKFISNKYVNNTMKGIRPVVIGIIAGITLSIAYSAYLPNGFGSQIQYDIILISAFVFAVKFRYRKINPILLVIIGAIMGMCM